MSMMSSNSVYIYVWETFQNKYAYMETIRNDFKTVRVDNILATVSDHLLV